MEEPSGLFRKSEVIFQEYECYWYVPLRSKGETKRERVLTLDCSYDWAKGHRLLLTLKLDKA